MKRRRDSSFLGPTKGVRSMKKREGVSMKRRREEHEEEEGGA